MNNFNLWLEQPVTFSGGAICTRRDYIPEFTKDLEAFMNGFGYKFINVWKAQIVAKWLYTIHIREVKGDTSSFPYEVPYHRDTIEDRAHFDSIINEDAIDYLFGKWQDCSDLSMDTDIGNVVRQEVLRFMWNYVDLDISYQGQLMASILYPESDSDTEYSTKRGDQYVEDSAHGYHG